jgi:hypothetical protein
MEAAEKERYQEQDTRIIIRRNSRCPKSEDGQHSWEPREGYFVCRHCGQMTEEHLLLD